MHSLKAYIFILISCIFWCCSGSSDGEYDDEGVYRGDNDGTDCGFEDGTHSATVNYHNPETGHSATYDLEVDVEDCQVTTIYFPKGGWLDDSHISPSQLDDGGDAFLEDEKGRTFGVHIDN